MKLAEIQETLESLDRAYDTIADEVSAARQGRTVPAWESIVRARPTREAGVATGDLQCATHGGAPHGLLHDALSDHLASEMAAWLRLAEDSPTARSALRIEQIAPSAGARLGAILHADSDLELRTRLAVTGDAVVPTEAGRWLWVPEAPKAIGFRRGAEAAEPYLLFSNDGKGRRWSFTDVEKGYEEYLVAAGKRHDEAALAQLRSCPSPKLLGAIAEHNMRTSSERAPLALSEAWLWDGGPGEVAGELAEPCEACRFGMSAWMCGHGEMLARSAAANMDYARASREWAARLQERRPPRSVKGPSLDSEIPPADPGSSAFLGGVAAAETGTLAAALLGGSPGTARAPMTEAPMLDLPERDVTGRDRRRGGAVLSWPERGGGAAEAASARRDRVRVRLDSGEFPCDNVEIRELHGEEAISRLFSFHVDIVCFEEDGLDTEKMLGAGVSLVFEQGSLEVRRVYGMVAEVTDKLETESMWRSYRLWIVPRVWRSTLVETQEVYLDTSVPDLVAQKLALVGLAGADVEMRLRGTYPARELTVQYKETDVAFVSRLAEHLGICFFFEHEGGSDKIVFSDDNSGFRPLVDAEVVPFRPRGEKVDIFELEARSRAFPASFAVQDYNYRTPLVDLTRVFESPQGFGGGVVEYGAHHKTPAEGAPIARLRAEERAVENRYYVGRSDRSQLAPGGTFTLSGHPRLEGAELLVVEVEHHALQTVKMQGAAGGDEPYRNTFRAVEKGLAYRPPRATPRPRIHGVLTALVEPNPSGEVGEQAMIDAEGRYTVKFYFDAGDVAGRPKNSRPVRMIQAHAGPSYGVHFPLKPGVEVLIVFMDGDPDRPLIVGSVPNPITPSPVVEEVNLMNRIETASGLIIEMRDAVPPLAK